MMFDLIITLKTFLLTLSIIYFLYILIIIGYKMFLFFRLDIQESVFDLNKIQLIILWISLSIITTYLLT